jgi:hypothetical protein
MVKMVNPNLIMTISQIQDFFHPLLFCEAKKQKDG